MGIEILSSFHYSRSVVTICFSRNKTCHLEISFPTILQQKQKRRERKKNKGNKSFPVSSAVFTRLVSQANSLGRSKTTIKCDLQVTLSSSVACPTSGEKLVPSSLRNSKRKRLPTFSPAVKMSVMSPDCLAEPEWNAALWKEGAFPPKQCFSHYWVGFLSSETEVTLLLSFCRKSFLAYSVSSY